MQFSVDVPNFGMWADPRRFAEFAKQVEDAGWDGLSVWDHILVEDGLEVADPWVLMSAAAMVTDQLRLMMMVTPVPRRHPWKLARESVTLDLLSEGRLILGVGTGWPTDPEFTRFHGPEDLRVRANMLDEGLEILDGLWSGEPFEFHGDHYDLEQVVFKPTPNQHPRIPIWVAAMWPRKRPVRRAARWDGIAPLFYDFETDDWLEPTPGRLRDLVAYISGHRDPDEPFDIALGANPSHIQDFADAGVTWWRDGWVPGIGIDHDEWLEMVLAGPPTLA